MKSNQTCNGSVNLSDSTMGTLTINGSARLKNISCVSLKVNGQAVCENLTIEQSLTVFGSCTIEQGACQQASVYGNFKANKVQIHGEISLFGEGSFTDCTLGNVKIFCEKVYFSHTTLKYIRIIIPRSSWRILDWFYGYWFSKTQCIYLTHGSVIEGDVVFEKGKGNVVVSAYSCIKGTVIGGKII